MIRHLSNEGEQCKIGYFKKALLREGGGQIKRVKEDEYS
jgi:hypothetical protein